MELQTETEVCSDTVSPRIFYFSNEQNRKKKNVRKNEQTNKESEIQEERKIEVMNEHTYMLVRTKVCRKFKQYM